MLRLALICLAGALAPGQQPPVLVEQTELPPPSETAVSAQAEPAAAVSEAPKNDEGQEAPAEAASSSLEPEPASDQRVAAFWLILPEEG